MIHLVEGPNGVGKTTFARHLAARLKLPYVEDLAKGAVEPGQREAVYVAHILILDQLAAHVDLVADRGWLSTIAFCRLYDRRIPIFLRHVGGWAVRDAGAHETIYRVQAPEEVVVERMLERGESVHPAEVEREFRAFDRVFYDLARARVPVVYVDGERGMP